MFIANPSVVGKQLMGSQFVCVCHGRSAVIAPKPILLDSRFTKGKRFENNYSGLRFVYFLVDLFFNLARTVFALFYLFVNNDLWQKCVFRILITVL